MKKKEVKREVFCYQKRIIEVVDQFMKSQEVNIQLKTWDFLKTRKGDDI